MAGLSGAALTSASLALVGGGSLAAGGLGMAGGTAIIAGGGALLGTAASGTASAIALSSKDEILEQCVTMLAYCKCVLVGRNQNIEDVLKIKKLVEDRILELEGIIEQIDHFKLDKDAKKQLQNQKACLKYLKKCDTELAKLITECER